MFDSIANQLLTMMGHGGKEGSVSGEALASALDSLASAITREQDKSVSGNSDEHRGTEGLDESQEVMLSARATPLLEMLRRAKDADGYVMWRPE